MYTRDHNGDCNEYWIFNFGNFKVQSVENTNQIKLIAIRNQLYEQFENDSEKTPAF